MHASYPLAFQARVYYNFLSSMSRTEISPGVANSGTLDVPRGFTGRQAVEWAILGSKVAAAGVVWKGTHRAWQVLNFLGGAVPRETTYPSLKAISQHTQQSFDATHIVVVGDSLARGYVEPDMPPYSAGELIRDDMKDLHKDWTCTVLAENGRKVPDLMVQLDAVPDIVRGERDVDIILSIGGNDLHVVIEEQKKKVAKATGNIFTLITSGIDRKIMEGINDMAGQYERLVIPKLIEVKKQLAEEGTNLNRVAFINYPNLSDVAFSILTETSEEVNNQPRGDNIRLRRRLGSHLPATANRKIGKVLERARDRMSPGTDFLVLDTFRLSGPELNAFHATFAGQLNLANQYESSTLVPSTDEHARERTDVTLFETISAR